MVMGRRRCLGGQMSAQGFAARSSSAHGCVSCCGFYQSSQLCLLGLPAREKKTCQNTTPDISACKAGLWVMGLCAPLGLFPWGCSALMETSTEELQWVRRGCHGLYVCVRGCSYNTTSRMLRTTEVK